MAMQGFGTAPGRNAINAVGTSKSRAEALRPVPLILSAMKPADAKTAALKNFKGK